MPLPAGYSLDNGSGTLPAGYKLDTNYSPVVPPSGAHDSLVSDALKYSPVGAVKGMADMLRNAAEAAPGAIRENADAGPLAPAVALVKGVGKTVRGMAESNETLWEKAKKSFKEGDYIGASAHFLNYLIPGGQALDDAGESFRQGDVAHGVAKTVGLASNFGVPAVMEGITSPEAARVPGAIVEGVKAAAPDVAKGAAKAAVGEVIAKVPGMEWPARVGVQYPAVRQMKAGGAAGVKAFKAALQDKIQAIVDKAPEAEESAPEGPAQKLLNAGPIVTPPPADTSFVRGEAQEWSPSQGKWVPKGTAPDAVAPPAKTETPAPKTPAINPDTAQLDAIAQAGVFGKKYKSFAAAPAEAQATIRGVVQGMAGKSEPVTAPLPQTATPGNAPVTTSLRDMMRNLPEEEARAEFLRQREAGTSAARAVADGMYAQGKQAPGEAAKTYEAAARSDKANKLAEVLNKHGILSSELEFHTASDLVKMMSPAAKAIGINAPSTTTIPEILFRLRRLEAKK